MANNNSAHTLVDDRELFEDFFGVNLSRWLADSASRHGRAHAGLWSNTGNAAEHASLDGWGGLSVAQAYTRSGSVWTMPLTCPSVTVEDEPDHGRHTCEWVSELAATHHLHDTLMALEDRSGSDNRSQTQGPGWLFADDTLWFDPTNHQVREVVERFEFAELGTHEDYITELEGEYVRQVSWPQWLDMYEAVLDSTVDRDRLFEAFTDHTTNGCTQCYVSTKPGEIAGEIMRMCGTDNCDVWTAARRSVCEYDEQV